MYEVLSRGCLKRSFEDRLPSSQHIHYLGDFPFFYPNAVATELSTKRGLKGRSQLNTSSRGYVLDRTWGMLQVGLS
jgi:hypothetical protein